MILREELTQRKSTSRRFTSLNENWPQHSLPRDCNSLDGGISRSINEIAILEHHPYWNKRNKSLTMTDQELTDLRREKWRLNANPVRTLDDARSFIESVGFSLTYPSRTPLLVPTFIGAWFGSDERLPRHRAFLDPEAREGTDLMVRMLRD